MSYIINNTRGNVIAIVADGTVNTTATDLALVGRALVSYGRYENENYVYLLENFANPTPPLQPILGQLWYNSSTDAISTYTTANTWVGLANQDYVQAQKVSPAFSGTPTAPTAALGTNSTQIATTAFVNATLSNFSGDFNNAHLTGNSTAITAPLNTNTTQIATTEFVISQLSGANSIVTAGNVTAGNVLTSGIVSAVGSIYASNFVGNISFPAGSPVNTTGNVTAGNILTNGIVSAAGNITTASTLIADTVIANTVITTGTTSAFRLPNLTQTQINALTSQNGDMVYNTTTNLPQVYQNGSWKNFTISYYS